MNDGSFLALVFILDTSYLLIWCSRLNDLTNILFPRGVPDRAVMAVVNGIESIFLKAKTISLHSVLKYTIPVTLR